MARDPDNSIKPLFRKSFASLGHFRAGNGYSFNSSFNKVNQAWKAGFPRSAESLFELMGQIVYGVGYNQAVKTTVRARKDPATCLASSPIAELLDYIKTKHASEMSTLKSKKAIVLSMR